MKIILSTIIMATVTHADHFTLYLYNNCGNIISVTIILKQKNAGQ